MNLFIELEREIQQLKAVGRIPVGIAMTWDYFYSTEVETSYYTFGWEAQYIRHKLNPTTPLEMCGLPVCFTYAPGNAVPLTWAVASVGKYGTV